MKLSQLEKYLENINQSDNILRCPKTNNNKVFYLQRKENAITLKPLFRTKSTFLSKLDLSEAITWQLFKSLSLRP